MLARRSWLDEQHKVLGTSWWSDVKLPSPCHCLILFAGTGADFHALTQLIGRGNCRCVACDTDDGPSRFFIEAHQPEHYFKQCVHELLADGKSSTRCLGANCGEQYCESMHEAEVDILTAGFPCVFFSVLNQNRWTATVDAT